MNKNQKGFGFVETLLVIVVLGILGFVVWSFYQKQTDDTATTNPASTNQARQDQAPEINKVEDLNQAESYLNNTDIDRQLDTSEIDNSLSE